MWSALLLLHRSLFRLAAGFWIPKYCVRYGCVPRAVYEKRVEERMAELKAIPHGKKNRLVSNQG